MIEKKQLDYEKAVLIGVISQHQNEEKSQEYLDEFKEKVFEAVKKIHISRFPYNDFLYQEYE